MYIGFDISTTCTGIAVVSDTGELLLLDHLAPESKPGAKGRPFRLGEEFRERFRSIRTLFPEEISGIFVEEPLISSSNANTCATLLRHNGICAWILYQECDVTPEWLSVRQIRGLICPELLHYTKPGKPPVLSFPNGFDKQAKKSYIQQKLARWYPNAEWVYRKVKNRTTELAPATYDRSDALALTLAGMLEKNVLKFKDVGERPQPI